MSKEQLETILRILKIELSRILGDQLEAVYLYGSQARGDARSDSDIDILVVLREGFNYFDMIEKTGQVVTDLSLENDTVITLAFVSKDDYERRHTPFLMNIQREGIAV